MDEGEKREEGRDETEKGSGKINVLSLTHLVLCISVVSPDHVTHVAVSNQKRNDCGNAVGHCTRMLAEGMGQKYPKIGASKKKREREVTTEEKYHASRWTVLLHVKPIYTC